MLLLLIVSIELELNVLLHSWSELQTFRTQDLSFPRTKGPYGELSFPRNESSRFHRNESSRNFRSQGTKVPGNEKSRERKFPLGTIRSWERKVLGTKCPGTVGHVLSAVCISLILPGYRSEGYNILKHADIQR